VGIFPSVSQGHAARRVQARHAQFGRPANIFQPGSVESWNWKHKDSGFLHFLCGESGLDEKGLFLKTGEGRKDCLHVVDVVELFLQDMKMQQVCVLIDGLPNGDYASQVVASITTSLEQACQRSSAGQAAVKRLVVAIASGGRPGAYEDALLESLAEKFSPADTMRQFFASTGGQDVFVLQRSSNEAEQVHFAATMLEAAQRASSNEDAAEVTVIFHQGIDDTYGLKGCGSRATVVSGTLQGDNAHGQKTMLPALMHDLCIGDTSVYQQMRAILAEMMCGDGLPSSDARVLATQCACVLSLRPWEPARGGEHLVAALAMLMLLHGDLLQQMRHWRRAVALSEQLQG
jgi:hypothetical protein